MCKHRHLDYHGMLIGYTKTRPAALEQLVHRGKMGIETSGSNFGTLNASRGFSWSKFVYFQVPMYLST